MNCTTRHGYRQHRELLQRELGQWAGNCNASLTPMHQRIVHTLDWLDVQALLGYGGKRPGAPERSRLALAQAFVAKAVLGLGQTKQLRERLLADAPLRRLLGFESNMPIRLKPKDTIGGVLGKSELTTCSYFGREPDRHGVKLQAAQRGDL